MACRPTVEKLIYWTIQITILLCVALTTLLSLKNSLHKDDSHHSLVRNPGARVQVKENRSCRYPLVRYGNSSCKPPCEWSFMSSMEREIYDRVMSFCLKIALVAMVITFVTWIACKSMRKFPHIVRFYILTSSISFTMAGVFPGLLNMGNISCVGGRYWSIEGMVSSRITFQGAACHYFLLTLSFCLLCYVINTYLVLVLNKHYIFTKSGPFHVVQFLFCFASPIIFVGICLVTHQPGYNMLFKDRLAILPSSHVLVFGTIMVPVLLCSGGSMSLLVAVVNRIRNVSSNPLTADHVIRSEEEVASLKNVERHFFIIVFIYVLSMALIFIGEAFLQDQEIIYLHHIQKYFSCLQTEDECTEPNRPKFFFSSLKILIPGFFCVVSFFLLFFTEETRTVWSEWLRVIRCQVSFSSLNRRGVALRRGHYSMRNADRNCQDSAITLGLESVASISITQVSSACENMACDHSC